MIFNENGVMINEGLFSKFINKNKKEEKYLTEEQLQLLRNNYKKIYSLIQKTFNKNLNIIAKKFDSKEYYEDSLKNIFGMYNNVDLIDSLNNIEYKYRNKCYLNFVIADIYKLVYHDPEDNDYFFSGPVDGLCELINKDIKNLYPSIKIDFDPDCDRDDVYLGCKVGDLLKI